MASRFIEIVVDANDPPALARFWAEVLGYHVIEEEDGVVEIGPWPAHPADYREQAIAAPPVPTLVFVPVPERKQGKVRLHIDVSPTDRTTADEVERLLALGATRAEVGQQGDESWVVLADPEGNEFCVLRSLSHRA
jgi:catechol 2,3-dioxygenase-like lactoylglutathione lyase family enzyme